jgi:micrococcal nuclease
MSRYYNLRGRRGKITLASLIAALLIAFAQHQGWLSKASDSLGKNQPGLYSVTHFVDGDTITVDMNGKPEKVRFIGVDTPETHKPNTPVQCYGPAAAAFTKNFIGSNKVRLESDPLSTNRDRYDRLLRYVYLPDGTLVNERLIQGGFGFYYPYFPFTKSAQFSAAQNTAKATNKGVWGNCTPTMTDQGGYLSNNQ